MNDTSLIIFDLDGTLTLSKTPVDAEMAGLLDRLLETHTVAVISGGTLTQLLTQFVNHLTKTEFFSHLYLLPTSGSTLYTWDAQKNSWEEQYAEKLTFEEKEVIMSALTTVRQELGDLMFEGVPFKDQAEDRETQITFSALGQHADLAQKNVWDPDRAKRTRIAKLLQRIIPQFEIRIGGSTSIDITKKGVDKAFGLTRFFTHTGIQKTNALFVGDAIFPGGNDYPAQTLGLKTYSVKDPEETKKLIVDILTHTTSLK